MEGSYQRFFWSPTQRLWRVQDKSGVILEFGVVQGETDAIESAPGDAKRVFRSNLNRQVDSFGNELTRRARCSDGSQVGGAEMFSAVGTEFPHSCQKGVFS